MKVKNGAENMIQSISGAHHGRDKKLLAEAQQMLADSKAKIEFLKLRILKVRRNGQSSKVSIESREEKPFSYGSIQMASSLSFSLHKCLFDLYCLILKRLYSTAPLTRCEMSTGQSQQYSLNNRFCTVSVLAFRSKNDVFFPLQFLWHIGGG